MQICLINPPQTALWNPLSYPPLGLLYVAAGLEQADFRDVAVHNQPHRSWQAQCRELPEADLYGITATTVCLPVTRKIVRWIRRHRHGAKIAVGGIHATVDAAETLEYTKADLVIDGEGEYALPEALRSGLSALDGRIVRAERIYTLDELPLPARHLLPPEVVCDQSGIHAGEDAAKKKRVKAAVGRAGENEPATTIITSRGCCFACSFCCKTRITRGVRYRSPQNIFAELEYLDAAYGIKQFRIVDDAFTYDADRVEDLMKMTAGRGWGFTTILRADSVRDPDMLRRLAAGGVHTTSFGVESASQAVLDRNNKRESIEEIKQAIRWCQEVGITVKVFLIFGLPGETVETVEETKEFFREIRPDSYTLSSFQPLPGSAIYDDPARFGLTPLYKKGEYEDYWFYYEPDDHERGFHFKMPIELRRARGELIRWLRKGDWK